MQNNNFVPKNMILCNACNRMISVKGLKTGVMERDEYEVTFFYCPLCGKRYLIKITDPAARQMESDLRTMRDKIAVGRQKGFRLKTLQQYARNAKKLMGEMARHAAELKETGEQIID